MTKVKYALLKYKLLTTVHFCKEKNTFKKIALLYVIICVHIVTSNFLSDVGACGAYFHYPSVVGMAR